MAYHGEAEFLLDLWLQNLFQPVNGHSDLGFRCKLCEVVVKRWERASHHEAHRAERNRRLRRKPKRVPRGMKICRDPMYAARATPQPLSAFQRIPPKSTTASRDGYFACCKVCVLRQKRALRRRNRDLSDAIECRECGAVLLGKLWKHLETHGMTVDEYRARHPGARTTLDRQRTTSRSTAIELGDYPLAVGERAG